MRHAFVIWRICRNGGETAYRVGQWPEYKLCRQTFNICVPAWENVVSHLHMLKMCVAILGRCEFRLFVSKLQWHQAFCMQPQSIYLCNNSTTLSPHQISCTSCGAWRWCMLSPRLRLCSSFHWPTDRRCLIYDNDVIGSTWAYALLGIHTLLSHPWRVACSASVQPSVIHRNLCFVCGWALREAQTQICCLWPWDTTLLLIWLSSTRDRYQWTFLIH